MYFEDDMRGMQSQIIGFIRDLLSQYNLTVQEVIRMTIQQLAIGATNAIIDKIVECYERYRKN